MSIFAAHSHRTTNGGPLFPFDDDGAQPPQTPVEQARLVQEALEHHRRESRKLAQAAKEHRDAVAHLLEFRLEHAIQLQADGWNASVIGRAYRLSRERIRQLLATARDGGEVA